jgi:pyrimidine operon attenuation protein/uracil phosphoribosyltransferase
MSAALDASGVAAAIRVLADAVVAAMRAGDAGRTWALVGIRTGGLVLADRLSDAVVAAGLPRPLRGDVDITLYRDDLYTGLERPVMGHTELPFEVTGTGIVLVDDVLFTGRTVRAALGEISDFGRPAFVRLAVLVDRGHRELPITADFVGHRVETTLRDRVDVCWQPDEVRVERHP